MIPNIGPLEIAIVLIIALVVFGPKRLPELGKSIGNGLKEFKGSMSDDGPAAIEAASAEGPVTKAGAKPEEATHNKV
ncbi:MAG TPA: twin-arginine translocase TatA/TatE family subunit [Solirubrobacterales bacterium]|nr:twin-arginine translocase TatA/TatE family subunit [Solirubrobacterales bacterium]